jgi:hypothetical protein
VEYPRRASARCELTAPWKLRPPGRAVLRPPLRAAPHAPSMNHLAGLGIPFDPADELDGAQQLEGFAALAAEFAPGVDDVTLTRFLLADSCNAEKSAARLRGTLEWRAAAGVEKLAVVPPAHWAAYSAIRVSSSTDSPPPHTHTRSLQLYILAIHIPNPPRQPPQVRRWVGEDLSGRPVMFERLGQFLGLGNHRAFDQARGRPAPAALCALAVSCVVAASNRRADGTAPSCGRASGHAADSRGAHRSSGSTPTSTTWSSISCSSAASRSSRAGPAAPTSSSRTWRATR